MDCPQRVLGLIHHDNLRPEAPAATARPGFVAAAWRTPLTRWWPDRSAPRSAAAGAGAPPGQGGTPAVWWPPATSPPGVLGEARSPRQPDQWAPDRQQGRRRRRLARLRIGKVRWGVCRGTQPGRPQRTRLRSPDRPPRPPVRCRPGSRRTPPQTFTQDLVHTYRRLGR